MPGDRTGEQVLPDVLALARRPAAGELHDAVAGQPGGQRRVGELPGVRESANFAPPQSDEQHACRDLRAACRRARAGVNGSARSQFSPGPLYTTLRTLLM